mmetsp:Transcript_20150/g.35803  ORF Transcript_20150/g.35803 Transcript_20150/m.35803 type:complete len:528 (+) Transcript_20150:93-1676(+)|eukprot:CAMPEP_0197631644 /NCGR_PEP_ID=MMETSP1338-20131121/8746_1 /TAXON_ID=43686 ORGANISM="Pelagodinium beii, Strain RCC1491" /NCGR_SAMPLE_ID=MMETSP1338 /ASSEMBLY_ACC=CAM_ASM_000754 /LENGTH=527 /DNA_ID=CAMNT_0043203153 /DNA_START=18 /DNA_END=1601 /DNA_ORIENTATION=-
MASAEQNYSELGQMNLRTSLSQRFDSREAGQSGCWHATMKRLNVVLNVVIVLNTLEMGAEAQWKQSEFPALETVYQTFNIIFTGFYIVEVALGIADKRLQYFQDKWNILDVCITTFGMVDIITDLQSEAAVPNQLFDTVKLARLLRLLRILRILKVMKSVPDLVIVIEGLVRSVKALGWVLCLLMLVVYVFAIFTTNVIDNALFQKNYFGDTFHAFVTLVDIAIGSEWGSIVRPLLEHQPVLLLVFGFFVLISTFGMLNVMIGVIVDSTAESKLSLEMERRKQQIEEASQMWKDSIHANGLSAEDIRKSSGAERSRKQEQRRSATQEILQAVLDKEDGIEFPPGLGPEDLYDLLDFDAGGDLSHAEFKDGLHRLLFGNSFQLCCLTMTMIGKLRRERQKAEDSTESHLAQILEHLRDGKPVPATSPFASNQHRADSSEKVYEAVQQLSERLDLLDVKHLSARLDRVESTLQQVLSSSGGQQERLAQQDDMRVRMDRVEARLSALDPPAFAQDVNYGLSGGKIDSGRT